MPGPRSPSNSSSVPSRSRRTSSTSTKSPASAPEPPQSPMHSAQGSSCDVPRSGGIDLESDHQAASRIPKPAYRLNGGYQPLCCVRMLRGGENHDGSAVRPILPVAPTADVRREQATYSTSSVKLTCLWWRARKERL